MTERDTANWRAAVVALTVLAVVVAGCASGGLLADDPEGPTPATNNTRTYEVTVERVVDGDTFEFTYANGTRDTVRLVGVDTPEVHVETQPGDFEGVPDTEAARDCLRDWGHRASEFARTGVLNETVTLTLDPREGPRDRYGRLLAYVHADGDGSAGDGNRSLNYELIAQGYATVYPTGFAERDRFDAALADAQAAGYGVWECREPATDGGNATDGGAADANDSTASDADANGSALAVAKIRADAPGNDHENLDGEYVVFENRGSEPLDLSGWTVRDDADHEYRFPDGFTLEPGATVTLYTGSGTDTDSALYWGAERAVWNNGGDTVVVADDAGEVVLRESYS
jgi:micrococcal nuclease